LAECDRVSPTKIWQNLVESVPIEIWLINPDRIQPSGLQPKLAKGGGVGLDRNLAKFHQVRFV